MPLATSGKQQLISWLFGARSARCARAMREVSSGLEHRRRAQPAFRHQAASRRCRPPRSRSPPGAEAACTMTAGSSLASSAASPPMRQDRPRGVAMRDRAVEHVGAGAGGRGDPGQAARRCGRRWRSAIGSVAVLRQIASNALGEAPAAKNEDVAGLRHVLFSVPELCSRADLIPFRGCCQRAKGNGLAEERNGPAPAPTWRSLVAAWWAALPPTSCAGAGARSSSSKRAVACAAASGSNFGNLRLQGRHPARISLVAAGAGDLGGPCPPERRGLRLVAVRACLSGLGRGRPAEAGTGRARGACRRP